MKYYKTHCHDLNINVNVNICKDQEETSECIISPCNHQEGLGLNLQGASCRSAKRPGDQEGGARGTEHPLLNINGAKSSVNFYREGRTKKAAKASTFVNVLA